MQPTNLSELEQIITTLVADAKCACHIINPHKTRILMWQQVQPDGTVIYHLRIGIQKFVSQPQKDRNGETYWRYYEFKKEVPTEPTPSSPEPEKINKSDEPSVSQQPS